MPLVLGLRLGEDVFVGDTPFKLEEITSVSQVKMRNEKSGKVHDVSVGRSTQVLPNVFFAMGDRSTSLMSRISIEAPRTTKVLTGAKYRALHQVGEAVRPPPGGAKKDYKIPADIVEKAKSLGIYGASVELRVQEMAKASAPITMPGFNLRFEQYVMFANDDGTIIALDVLSQEDRDYYDKRAYDERRGDDHVAGEAEVEWKSGHDWRPKR